nr:hypothetical protein [Rhizoctonia sp.]
MSPCRKNGENILPPPEVGCWLINHQPLAAAFRGLPAPHRVRLYSLPPCEGARKLRGRKVFIYDTKTSQLIFKSESIQYLVDKLNIHRSSVNGCATTGKLFLGRFFISFEPIVEMPIEDIVSIDVLNKLFEEIRTSSSSEIQPKSRPKLAENVLHPDLTKEYPSLNSFAMAVKGDRETIRQYLNGQRSGQLHRKQWKLIEL